MDSFESLLRRMTTGMRTDFENGLLGEAEYRRLEALIFDFKKSKVGVHNVVTDEIAAEKLRLYFKAMNINLNAYSSGDVNSGEHRNGTMKFKSSLCKLSEQQLAERFLNGEKVKNKPMIPAVKPEFADCVKTLLGSIELLSTPGLTAKRKGDEVDEWFRRVTGPDAVQQQRVNCETKPGKKQRRQKEELESEESLFRTAKDRLRNLELASGAKPGYAVPRKDVKQKTENNEPENKFSPEVAEIMEHELGKSLDPALVEKILFDIVENIASIKWDDISGLEFAKESIQEIVVLPMLRPDLFTGLLSPCKGLLLFGPPGTGKTLIGKCIASESSATFFSISASSLTSKWIGEGEKMVRTLFTIARIKQPSVIFIDEIDSLLTQRSDTEHEASRRLKTEFLIQFDGLTTDNSERLLVIGATNRPQELDEAARRRFVKRLYIPLPTRKARKEIIKHLMKNENHRLTEEDFEKLSQLTAGYSCADVTNLCKEAALGPIRRVGAKQLKNIEKSALPPITMADFVAALKVIKPSVSEGDLEVYNQFNNNFGAMLVPTEEDDGAGNNDC